MKNQTGTPATVPVAVNDIGWAIVQMRHGIYVTRKGWNGKGQSLGLQIPDPHSANTLPYIYIITVKGERVPWLASQTDLLSSDWIVFSEQ